MIIPVKFSAAKIASNFILKIFLKSNIFVLSRIFMLLIVDMGESRWKNPVCTRIYKNTEL